MNGTNDNPAARWQAELLNVQEEFRALQHDQGPYRRERWTALYDQCARLQGAVILDEWRNQRKREVIEPGQRHVVTKFQRIKERYS
jgi:hypothetical protein